MQFFLKRTNCEELEKECIEYAKKQNAMYFYEKPPGNTHVLYIKLIGLHLKNMYDCNSIFVSHTFWYEQDFEVFVNNNSR